MTEPNILNSPEFLQSVVKRLRAQASAEKKGREQQRLSREQQILLSKQTYAPMSLIQKPRLLRAYLLLFSEFGGARPWTGPMSSIAAALNGSERQARDRVKALETAGVLEIKRQPGQESEYRLLRESRYIEMPLAIAVTGNHAVCAVWGALRISLGRGQSALKRVTAITRMAWARVQDITGLCRTVVAEALRWLRQQGWLSRQVVWKSLRPIRRAVCQWKLRLRTPAEIRTPPRNESGQLPFGDSRDLVEPQAGPSINPGPGEMAAKEARESGTEGVDLLTAWRNRVRTLPT